MAIDLFKGNKKDNHLPKIMKINELNPFVVR